MAIIRYPTLDQTQQGEDAGTAYKAYVDTATGQVLKEVKTGNSEDGFQTTFQPVAGKTWEFANRAGTGGQQIYGSQGYVPQQFTQNGEDTGFSSGAAGAITPRGDWQVGDWQADKKLSDFLQQNGVTPKYDPAYGWVIPAESNPGVLMTKYRDSIYTGGDWVSNLLDKYGPAIVGGIASAGILSAGAAGAAAPGVGGEIGVQGIYNTGAGGFGAPLSAYEAALPISAGIDASAAGLTGSLTGMGGLTPLADAAAAGALGGTPVGGITSATGTYAPTAATQVGGTSAVAPEFNINDPSTWPNLDTTGLPNIPNTSAPPDLLSQYTTPLPNTGGLPSAGSVVDLANSANMTSGIGGTAAAATTTGTGTPLSRILNGTATTEDWLSVGGNLGTGLLGAYASNSQADALKGIADQNRAERAPFLQKATTYLNDPAAYAAGPGQAALKGTLAGLSVQGNPFGSGTALQFATDTGNKNWLSAVNSLGSLGLGGQGIQANLDTQAVNSNKNAWQAVGAAASNIFNPAPSQAQTLTSLAQLLKQGNSNG